MIEPLIREDQQLARGGAGTVYQINLEGKDVAVKVCDYKPQEPVIYLQWKAETKYLNELNHDNIIKMIHFGDDKDARKLFVVYELMTGTVATQLQELNWGQTIKVLKQTAAALAFMHEQKPEALHNDIKPGNILLDKKFNVKLGDFGSATSIDKIPPTGTPGYTPTRSTLYRGNAHPKVDVYNFGVTSLQLLMKCDVVRYPQENTRRGKSAVRDDKHSEDPGHIVAIANRQPGHVVDGKLLQTGCSEETAIEITDLIKKCCDIIPGKRPHMKDVLKMLEKLK
ncbi:hypothetical protein SLEP1_g46145 [Rubroshorea leprosula]|uniref:Protein kinase domain-containing protein n=1 Tax=Rubroshorea leprosula TaxID=152421 RepID=A0AAV5LLA6_9ROSI|nr:hypothetical protein SLEP1_g46145 [Rubroshorea leprosula]